MKILTSRNGIALIGVLTILLVLTLLLPAMFTMSDSATKFAVQGKDRQKASYFARSLCEMAVATYKNTYDVEVPASNTKDYQDNQEYYQRIEAYQAKYDEMFQQALATQGVPSETTMEFSTVTMYENAAGDVQYSNEYKLDDNNNEVPLNPQANGYSETGTGTCTISYLYQELCYLVDNDTKMSYEVKDKDDFKKLYDDVKLVKDIATTQADIIKEVMGVNEVPAGHSFTVTKVMNKIVNFNAVATVKGKEERRKCVVILPTYPSEQDWLLYRGADYGLGNEVVVNPDKATGMTTINYNNAGFPGTDASNYKKQNLLTFSCLGNMHITTNNLKEGSYTWNKDHFDVTYVTANGVSVDSTKAIPAELPENAHNFVLDVAPGINTTPNNDPEWNILDGINTADYHTQTQCDNFIAMAATNSITVDLPVTLLVNPARANRLGDGLQACYSIYKSLIFQAPTIVFGGQVDMLVSFYDRPGNGLADQLLNGSTEIEEKRMASVVLSTPTTTEYRYNPRDEEGKERDSVKAGRVVFLEDCYVWVIDYADNGSGYSDHWYEAAQTVYYKNKDFTKIKVANAGDVFLYNAEIEMDGRPTGFSIAGYAIETIYYDRIIGGSATPWWQIWKKAQQDIFGLYVKHELFDKKTYAKDDLHLVGNIYDGTGNPDYLELPDADSIYTIWSS